MRVFVAGATGVVGGALVPQLVARSSTTSPHPREWLPVLAAAPGAKPPRRIPLWLARPLAGEMATAMMTTAKGASNAKAKRELGWQLRYPTWRQGFFEGLDETKEDPAFVGSGHTRPVK